MYEIYTVLENDTIEEISKRFGTTKEYIYQLNGLDDHFVVMPNMQLVVPKRKDTNYWYYTVKKGDNPYSIAKQYGVDYQLLLALNGLDDNDYIYPNQTLLIPKDDVHIYLTKNNDTIRDVMERNDVGWDELIKENEKIYLRPEQIIVFREK